MPKDRFDPDDDFAAENHPVLTPKGYRLLYGRSPLDGGQHSGVDQDPRDGIGDALRLDQVQGENEGPASPFDYFVRPPDREPLFNVLPSKRFPDPRILLKQPLTPYFESHLIGSIPKQLTAVGRLVIHLNKHRRSEPAFGSAWLVAPSLIATCAHNLYDSNLKRWSYALEFYPGFDYYQDATPLRCRITSGYIPPGYSKNPITNDDIAFCYLDRNLGDAGAATIPIEPVNSNDFFDHHEISIVGYPSGSEFDFGKQMWRSTGAYLFGRSSGPADDYSPVMATNFGGGSSGCPWLTKSAKTGGLVAVGLTSGHARLTYGRGELNLMSLSSPMLTDARMARLIDEQRFHDFAVD